VYFRKDLGSNAITWEADLRAKPACIVLLRQWRE
jgi:hypothetical protein